MKLLLLASLVMGSAFATETMIISQDRQFGPVVGFTDSSFNYRSQAEIKEDKFCFIGDKDKICGLVEKAVMNRNIQYSQGAHDRIEELTCKLHNHTDEDRYPDFGVVEVSYRLLDDYGSDFKAYRLIRPCVKSSIQ